MEPGRGVPAAVGTLAACALGCGTPLKQLECAEPESPSSTTTVQVTRRGCQVAWKRVEGRWRRVWSGGPIR